MIIPPRLRSRDHLGALLLIVMGGSVMWASYGYGLGHLTHMGSGFLPFSFGALLVLIGLLVAATAKPPAPSSHLRPTADAKHGMRGGSCVLAGIGAFVLLGRYGGLVPATFASVFISALGDRRNSARDAAILAAVLAVVGYVVFDLGLKLQLSAFQWS